MPLVSFYPPWKREKIFGFLMFSGVIKVTTGIKWANVLRAYFRKEGHAYDFSEKGHKKGKIEENIWKFGQKCTKFENILKKGSLMRATIGCMKQLEYVLVLLI